MSDLRRRLHAAVVVACRARHGRADGPHPAPAAARRRGGSRGCVVVLAAGGGVLAARGSARRHAANARQRLGATSPLRPRRRHRPPTRRPRSADDARLDHHARARRCGPVHATPTTGLGNFDDVTITATGLPAGSYDVAQCPSANARAGDFLKCRGLQIINVSDGHLTANLTVFWWMDTSNVDCGARRERASSA